GFEDNVRFQELWNELPEAGQMRCHVPIIGVRFNSISDPIAEISICWQCNNMFGETEQGSFHRTFDGESDSARELLSLCKRLLSIPEKG
ncbi:MAG: hypothetical protein ACI8RZ_005133, partial [Myxococcota bacterium]